MSRSGIEKLGGDHQSMPKGTKPFFLWLNKQPMVKRFSLGVTVGSRPRVPWKAKPQRILNGALLIHVRGDDVLMQCRAYTDDQKALVEAIVAEYGPYTGTLDPFYSS